MKFRSVFETMEHDAMPDEYTLLDISNSVVTRARIREDQDSNTNYANTSQTGVDPAAIDCSHDLQGKNEDQENMIISKASHSFIHKINKTSFKRKATKDARLKGKAYIGYKKMVDGSICHSIERPARSFGDRCSHNDKQAKSSRSFMCGLVSQADRDQIFIKFWDLKSWEAKRAMIRGLVATREAVRRRAETATDRNKELLHDCFLPICTGKVRVCKNIFVSTLGIGNDQFRRWTSYDLCASSSFDQAMDTTDVDTDAAARVAHSHEHKNDKQTSLEKKSKVNNLKSRERVKKWLELLPKVPSHYCRSTTKRIYVESTFRSIMHMYSVYKDYIEKESLNVQPVSRQVFSSILKQSNISIHVPRKDQCDICCMHEVGTIEESAYHRHILKKNICRDAKNEAKLSACDSHVVITVDLQSVLLSPRLQASSAYYKLKLQVHNL